MEQVKKLLELHCTAEEVAGWFDCSVDTVERRIKEAYNCTFAELSAAQRGCGRIKLRRKQFQKALRGDTKMLIWLGKQHLDQKDKREVEQHTSANVVVTRDDFDDVADWTAKYGADASASGGGE